MSLLGNARETWQTRQAGERTTGKKKGGSAVRGTEESDRTASLALA